MKIPFNGFSWNNLRNFRSLIVQSKSFATEAELIELFDPKGKPHYDRVFEPEIKREKIDHVKIKNKKEDVVISCRRKELNHFRNQKYDKLKPIPLASKGWHHRKSKGDWFTIKIYNENSGSDGLYWKNDISFSDLKLDSRTIDALNVQGITQPTTIQADSIPKILRGKNCLIAAETGCGKTYAYLLPIIEQLLKWSKIKSDRLPNTPLALILCPHRDLALQIGHVAKLMSHCLPFTCSTIIGGRTKKKMLNPEYNYVDLLIATPGALSKLITVGIYNVEEVRHVVVDEADTMLDDSFNELVKGLLRKFKISYINSSFETCQLTLVSATMPKTIYSILENIVEVGSLEIIKSTKLHRIMAHVPQTFYRLATAMKPTKLLNLAKKAVADKHPTLIFSNKSSTCDWISLMLNENSIPTLNLNGEMKHVIRVGKYKQFRDNEVYILSCTDIASRGLDTTNVKHVLNYDFPLYMADYIHRCGRTGRCGSPSETIINNFITRKSEIDLLQKIEMAIRLQEDLPNVDGNITKLINRKFSN